MKRYLLSALAAGASIALGFVAIGALWLDADSGVPPRSAELAQLAGALDNLPMRVVDGRLASGFSHAPPPPMTRGATPRELPPAVRIAAATIEKRALESTAPGDETPLALAYLILDRWDLAIDVLDDVVREQPADAVAQNELAVAYLARAAGADRPEDWASALAAANRSIAIDPGRPEPYFNRALAFGGLHLSFEEAEAWKRHLALERDGPWAREARERLDTVEARMKAAAAARPSEDDHQRMRERIEDDLLVRWGDGIEKGDTSVAATILADARQSAATLASSGGDAMARDEIARIDRFEQAGDRATIRRLALGHRLYGDARRLYAQDRQVEAADRMAEAAEHFRAASSPYANWAAVLRAISIRGGGNARAALTLLQSVPLDTLPAGYRHLRGRIFWTEGVAWDSLGRYDTGRRRMLRAIDEFQQAGETEYVISTQSILTEEEWFLGNRAAAWANVAAVTAALDRRPPSDRAFHFGIAATMSLGVNLPEAAVEFHSGRVRVAETPRARAEAYVRRAGTLATLGRTPEALADIEHAAEAIAQLTDPAIRQRNLQDLEVARTNVYSRFDCAQTIAAGDGALEQLARSAGTIRRSAVLTTLAGCRSKMGETDRARADLLAAIDVFEARRSSIVSPTERVQAFELEHAAFAQLIALDAVTRGDERSAWLAAERGRSGALTEGWSDRGAAGQHPLDHRALPAGVAVVYYQSLADRVLVWVLTKENRHTFSREIDPAALQHLVSRVLGAIQRGATVETIRPYSTPLTEALIAPALALADADAKNSGAATPPAIYFVPDGPLYALPFAALPDASGQPLLRSRVVGTVPSLASFFAASTRLGSFDPSRVLAIGDGHDPASTNLPRLPRADHEATAVGGLYPARVILAGSDATKARVLDERAPVIHFAGHAVLNERFPTLSRLLLAPGGDGEDGLLFTTEIDASRFGSSYAVFLATCEAAAGRVVEGEGAVSLARAFFAVGVPAVVASLWPVQDDLQTLVLTFHRELRTTRDAASALRAGQLALLEERGLHTPIKVWGGFTMLGGSIRLATP